MRALTNSEFLFKIKLKASLLIIGVWLSSANVTAQDFQRVIKWDNNKKSFSLPDETPIEQPTFLSADHPVSKGLLPIYNEELPLPGTATFTAQIINAVYSPVIKIDQKSTIHIQEQPLIEQHVAIHKKAFVCRCKHFAF